MRMTFLKSITTVLTAIGMLTMFSCSKDDLPDKIDEKTFSMLVDGEKWEISTIGIQPTATYYPGSHSIIINASKKGTDEILTLVANSVRSEGDYNLRFRVAEINRLDSTRLLANGDFSQSYLLLSESGSTLTIKKFDTVKNVIAGNFSLSLINKKMNKKSLTDGKFDLPLITAGQ